ncbi:MAG: type II toxin-antitoxin system prevent-host-death family antitoxin [Parasphingorhabdus sp.]|nr:type II toxin-antitoxin system prevent-host-death family antitoxin [Parasphingorhabdus sp.]
MITESFSNARENLGAIMDRVVTEKVLIKIKRPGAEGVVLVSETEWSSIEETLYLLASPANARQLMDAIRGLDAGEGVEHELTEKR